MPSDFESSELRHTKCFWIRSDEGLALKTSAFESLYGGQFTLSTQLIKPNYHDYFGQTCNGPITLPDREKLLQNCEGTTSLPVNAAAQNISFEVGIS